MRYHFHAMGSPPASDDVATVAALVRKLDMDDSRNNRRIIVRALRHIRDGHVKPSASSGRPPEITLEGTGPHALVWVEIWEDRVRTGIGGEQATFDTNDKRRVYG